MCNFFFCHYVFKKLSAAEASESVYMRERVNREFTYIWLYISRSYAADFIYRGKGYNIIVKNFAIYVYKGFERRNEQTHVDELCFSCSLKMKINVEIAKMPTLSTFFNDFLIDFLCVFFSQMTDIHMILFIVTCYNYTRCCKAVCHSNGG